MAGARFSPVLAAPGGRSICDVASGPPRLPSAIAAAIDELCADLERFQARQEERARLTRCIAAADDLVEDLEGLCLDGRSVVPGSWQPRLDRFVAALPPGTSGPLLGGSETTLLLDQVFEIEERLFRLKLGDWARAFEPIANRGR